MSRWLVVVPYYIFGSLVLGALFSVVARSFRLRVSMDRIAVASALGCVLGLAGVLASGLARIDDLKALPLLGLLVCSFVLAGIDEMLSRGRPLADEGAPKYGTTEPRVY